VIGVLKQRARRMLAGRNVGMTWGTPRRSRRSTPETSEEEEESKKEKLKIN
jgi:hypothetical protein